jgi:hypothetical protein
VPAVDRTGPGCVTRVTGMSDLVDRLVSVLEPTRVRSGNALDSVPEMREVLGLFEGGWRQARRAEVKTRRPPRRTRWDRSRHPLRRRLRSRGPPLSPRNITRGLHLLQPVRVCVLGGGPLDITLPRRGR